jgi:hypothetical protein
VNTGTAPIYLTGGNAMIKKSTDFWKILVIIGTIFLVLLVPFMTISAEAKPLMVTDSSFPDPATIWAIIEPRLVVLLLLTLFDFLFGVILALIAKTFQWDYLMHYLSTDILPILAWMAIVVVTQIPAEFIPSGALPVFEYGVYATVFLSIAASLVGQFQKIGVLSGDKKPDEPVE